VEVLMAVPNRQNAIDHVVAVMFEGRSFDHLLGRLPVVGADGVRRGSRLSARVLDEPARGVRWVT
jgi:phospholipase C